MSPTDVEVRRRDLRGSSRLTATVGVLSHIDREVRTVQLSDDCSAKLTLLAGDVKY